MPYILEHADGQIEHRSEESNHVPIIVVPRFFIENYSGSLFNPDEAPQTEIRSVNYTYRGMYQGTRVYTEEGESSQFFINHTLSSWANSPISGVSSNSLTDRPDQRPLFNYNQQTSLAAQQIYQNSVLYGTSAMQVNWSGLAGQYHQPVLLGQEHGVTFANAIIDEAAGVDQGAWYEAIVRYSNLNRSPHQDVQVQEAIARAETEHGLTMRSATVFLQTETPRCKNKEHKWLVVQGRYWNEKKCERCDKIA